MTLRFAAPGVMPGRDFRRCAQLLEPEVPAPHLSSLPELPARGHHASQLGRAVGQLWELYAELTSYGWRLVPRPGADHLRAATLLTSDVDTLADVRGELAEKHDAAAGSALMLEVLGPVSLAAQLHLPSGEKVLIDHGARRDLTESLAAGLAAHVEHLRRAAAPSSLSVVVLEQEFERVRTGSVPTVSGYQTIRALPRDQARDLIGVVVRSLRAAGADEVYVDFGRPVEAEHIEDFRARSDIRVDGFGLPVPELRASDWERTAELVESGATFLAALLNPAESGQSPAVLPEVSRLVARVSDPWNVLGMPPSALEALTLTAYGAAHRGRIAETGETGAMRTLTRLRDTTGALTDQILSG